MIVLDMDGVARLLRGLAVYMHIVISETACRWHLLSLIHVGARGHGGHPGWPPQHFLFVCRLSLIAMIRLDLRCLAVSYGAC